MPNLPTWRKVNPADSPIMILRVNSEMMPLIELSDYAETILARQLSQVNGVGQIFVVGQQRPAIRIQAQPEKLAAYQLTLADLRQSLQSASVNLAKGALYGEGRVSTLAANDQLFNASDYDDLVVAYRQGAPVFLKDVARIVSAPEDDYVQAWPNGVPGVALVILRQPGANIVDTADAIQAALPRLREMLPATIEVDVLNDRTRTIRSSLHEVELTLLLTIGLVVLVMGLFLRQLSATLIVATVLAVSLSASFAAMYVLGFTLNNLTLVALIIAVGFIVDDAIVVVENIHRHLEAGASKVEAALKGAAEIGFTVISISFSLIAAFIPLLFMGGIVGRLFREFAVSVTVAILISVVASLTLAPMLASRFMPALRHAEAPRKGFAEWLTGGYERGLRWALGHQRLMLVGFAFTVLVAVAGYVGIPKGFFPCRTPPSSSARARLPRISPTTTWSPSTGNWPRSSPATRRCRATTMRWASPAVARAWPTDVSGSSSRTVASAMSRSVSSSTGCARNWPRCRESCSTCARRRTSTSVPDPRGPSTSTPCAAATAPSWRSGRNASPSA